jgi:hypothetical protein
MSDTVRMLLVELLDCVVMYILLWVGRRLLSTKYVTGSIQTPITVLDKRCWCTCRECWHTPSSLHRICRTIVVSFELFKKSRRYTATSIQDYNSIHSLPHSSSQSQATKHACIHTSNQPTKLDLALESYSCSRARTSNPINQQPTETASQDASMQAIKQPTTKWQTDQPTTHCDSQPSAALQASGIYIYVFTTHCGAEQYENMLPSRCNNKDRSAARLPVTTMSWRSSTNTGFRLK